MCTYLCSQSTQIPNNSSCLTTQSPANASTMTTEENYKDQFSQHRSKKLNRNQQNSCSNSKLKKMVNKWFYHRILCKKSFSKDLLNDLIMIQPILMIYHWKNYLSNLVAHWSQKTLTERIQTTPKSSCSRKRKLFTLLCLLCPNT